MDAHRYWRVYAVSAWSTSFVSLSTLEMAETPGGANVAITGNGTASVSSYYAGVGAVAANAFDGNAGTRWATDQYAVTGAWLAWDFGSGFEKSITELRLVTPANKLAVNGNPEGPRVLRLEYSDDGSTWAASVAFPEIAMGYSVSATLTITSGQADINLPQVTVGAFSGGASVLHLPAIRASGTSGTAVAMQLPSLTATAQGHDSTGEQAADITLPSLSVTARAGANAKLTLPSLTIQAAGTVTAAASANINLPSLSVAAAATAAHTGQAALTLPNMVSKSYAGALCSVTIGKLTAQATGTTGSVGRAQFTLPLFQATAIATAGNHGYANIVLPSLNLHSGGNGAAIMLPGLSLTAIGSAVITATYEAYAVNLKHADPNANDEATRYTNFPFTHVVRYKNSYYGANSTGLYLLEGTTDNGAPIPWAFETAITDFKSPNKKTLAAAYFSGRFGTSSTIQLKKGEKSPITHAFTTPRGTLAQNHRQVFGKDRAETRTRYFALAASGTSEFELDAIECDVHNTTRRI